MARGWASGGSPEVDGTWKSWGVVWCGGEEDLIHLTEGSGGGGEGGERARASARAGVVGGSGRTRGCARAHGRAEQQAAGKGGAGFPSRREPDVGFRPRTMGS